MAVFTRWAFCCATVWWLRSHDLPSLRRLACFRYNDGVASPNDRVEDPQRRQGPQVGVLPLIRHHSWLL
jgi:hypothetical protein